MPPKSIIFCLIWGLGFLWVHNGELISVVKAESPTVYQGTSDPALDAAELFREFNFDKARNPSRETLSTREEQSAQAGYYDAKKKRFEASGEKESELSIPEIEKSLSINREK